MDIRVRMVLLGLVLGVVVAVIVAAQGCGENHPKKRTFHGAVPAAQVARTVTAAPVGGRTG